MDDTLVPSKPVLTNTVYDKLKWVALVGLPALGALYFTVAQIWGLPKPEEVLGTVVAVDTAMGLVLGLAKKNYDNSDAKYDGTLNVMSHDTRLIQQLDIQTPPEEMGDKNEIVLKVQKVDPE
jgi:hypothetical protein